MAGHHSHPVKSLRFGGPDPVAISVLVLAAGALVWVGLAPAAADTVSLQPISDTSLMERAPDNNLGGAVFFNAGTAGNGSRNRGLILFDLTSVIPPGSIITRGELTMEIVRQPSIGQQNSVFSLRRVFQSWGEGAQAPADPQSPGLGAPAEPGDATWNSRFAPDAAWSQPGGLGNVDFSATISSSAFVAALGDQMQFGSTPSLIADLQFWQDQPAANFGWMLVTESEALGKTARSFASRESGFGPTLTIEFEAVPEPRTLSLLSVGLLALAAATRGRRWQAVEKQL